MKKILCAAITATFSSLCLVPLQVIAETFPSRPVRLVVPFAPGGAVDTFARMISQVMGQQLGQSVIIENKAGAGGTMGSAYVAQAKPDGYTALLVYDTYAVAPLLYAKLPYDPAKLMPVSLLAKLPLVMLTANKVPSTLDGFLGFARSNPGGVTFSSGGPGSSGHLTAELLKARFGLQMTHVPYKGGGPAMNAVLSQEVDLTFLGTLATAQYVQSGKANAIAVMGNKGVVVLPKVPAISQLGHPDLEVYSWYGILLPAGTPPEIVGRMRGAITAAMADPETSQRIAEQGGVAVGSTPEEFDQFIRAETARWGKVVRAANIKLE